MVDLHISLYRDEQKNKTKHFFKIISDLMVLEQRFQFESYLHRLSPFKLTILFFLTF
jgi:hypothetical protein